MKRLLTLSVLAVLLFGACKSEKKINSYSDIYSERPTVIYIAPVNDKAERKVEKYPTDIAYNNEINTAKAYLFQTIYTPLKNIGYYVIGPAASKQIAETNNLSPKQLRNGDLSTFNKDYGIDAVLIITLHKWKDDNNKKMAFLEYQMRSTKTNIDLFHTWVMAVKEVPTNLKGDPITMSNDTKFAKRFDFDNGTAQRCFLVEKVNDYVLRNLPTSSLKRQFEKDLYRQANPNYIKYTWVEGGADVQNCSAEEYESNAFL